MEKGSEAKKNEYPQELKEQTAAALLLVSLKHKVLDEKTASVLHAFKKQILKESETKHNKLQAENIPTRVKQELNEETLDASQTLPGHPQDLCLLIEDYIPPATPPVARLSGHIGICSQPFEKQLTVSDLKDDQSRLTMSRFYVESFLLPLLGKKENLDFHNRYKEGIPVTIYDLNGNEYPMKFKIWAKKIYVLAAGWQKFYHDHALRKHQDFITVWMFRHTGTKNLCFVITWRRLPVYEPIKGKKAGKVRNN